MTPECSLKHSQGSASNWQLSENRPILSLPENVIYIYLFLHSILYVLLIMNFFVTNVILRNRCQ
jgi:hypothetical protein